MLQTYFNIWRVKIDNLKICIIERRRDIGGRTNVGTADIGLL